MGLDPRPEQHDVRVGESPGRDGSGVEHCQLTRRRQHRGDDHQQEHGVDAVITDQRRERARDAGDRHAERLPAQSEVALGD